MSRSRLGRAEVGDHQPAAVVLTSPGRQILTTPFGNLPVGARNTPGPRANRDADVTPHENMSQRRLPAQSRSAGSEKRLPRLHDRVTPPGLAFRCPVERRIWRDEGRETFATAFGDRAIELAVCLQDRRLGGLHVNASLGLSSRLRVGGQRAEHDRRHEHRTLHARASPVDTVSRSHFSGLQNLTRRGPTRDDLAVDSKHNLMKTRGPTRDVRVTRLGSAERTRGLKPRPEDVASKTGSGSVAAKKGFTPGAWEEARALVWAHRRRLGLGLVLMLVNRAAGLVLPMTSKWLMDDVVGKGRWDLLTTLALAAGAATLVESGSSFALSQILGVAAQRAITDMRKDVEAHVMHVAMRFLDSYEARL